MSLIRLRADRIRSWSFFAVSASCWVAPTLWAQPAGEPQATAPTSETLLEDERRAFRQHDMTLANPFFEGRAPGTRGNLLAADYVETYFKKAGLTPAFPKVDKSADGSEVTTPFATYRQPFQRGSNKAVTVQEASWTAADGKSGSFKPGSEFNVLAWSADGEVTAPLVFVGYSIANGPDEYTSFPEGSDLNGKIALVLRFEPMNEQGKSKWAEERWSFNANIDPKIGSAIRRGAAGVIVVSAPGADDERVNKLDDVNSLPANSGVQKTPVVMMLPDQADALVRAGDEQGRSLLDLRRIVDDRGEVIDLAKVTVTLKTKVDRSPIMTDNVGGVLKGKGALAEEYIVVGAHYDHVGYGFFGSRDPKGTGKIHPGADDNASGTSAMLVLADKFGKAYANLPGDANARSILFMGFSAEESGLNGSRHYTKNMIADKSKHYFMLNLDMVGRLNANQELEVSGIGTADGLEPWVKPYLDSSGMTIASKPGGTGPSDHASFFAAGVPVLFFFTGLHEQYHMPTDTADLINVDGAAKIIDLAYRIGFDMARRPEAFPYVADPRDRKKEVAAGDNPHAAGQGDPANSGVRSTTVKFGIMPGDYSGSETGVLIGGLTPGGWSAEKAGLKAGDRMTKWNDKDIDSVESWTSMLQTCKPGDKVIVTFVRDGKEQTTEVTLMARDSGAK